MTFYDISIDKAVLYNTGDEKGTHSYLCPECILFYMKSAVLYNYKITTIKYC